MGKGDQRSRRGKINRGTFGKRRPKNKNRKKRRTMARPASPAKKS
jgi:30S ribosomal protein S31